MNGDPLVYISIYYNLFFAIALISALAMTNKPVGNRLVNCPPPVFSWFIAAIAMYILAMFPIRWGSYEDREIYAYFFMYHRDGSPHVDDMEPIFTLYAKLMGCIFPWYWTMYLTAIIYVTNFVIAAKKTTGEYMYVQVLLILTSLFFFGYGENTIRGGFAASFMALAWAYNSNWKKLALFLFIAVGCHTSMALPTLCLLISRKYDKTKIFIYIWCASVVLSAVAGSFFESTFSFLISDDRTNYIEKSGSQADIQYNTGFRIDFIIYSVIPIITGYYYIYKLGFKDRNYKILYNTYILANTFWVLVIRANFTDRFGYLSWLFYPFLLGYPLLKYKFIPNQNQKIALTVLLNELFTYLLYIR